MPFSSNENYIARLDEIEMKLVGPNDSYNT